ncbi:MAG: hypothetical protein Ct9H300mP15_16870 [Gemmatimonadota bacterium]|nr:MAG: hypothetical protein Ct9H300mP15_16870 [Gemmatimonadota bacterium]
MDALDAARLGLDMMTHYYGLFEALFDDRTIQDFFPNDYNYNNEQHRLDRSAGYGINRRIAVLRHGMLFSRNSWSSILASTQR